ncbi:MAG: acyl carrier protein [Nitriliruptorales bacterium]|nr:acyl carrier protein [Nitriliruptorales bacterium]
MTVYDRVVTILNDRLGVPAEDVSPETTFEQLDLDSLDLVEFALGAEESFGVRISDDEAEGLRSVGDAVALLESKGLGVTQA